jgi:hypothetical protein
VVEVEGAAPGRGLPEAIALATSELVSELVRGLIGGGVVVVLVIFSGMARNCPWGFMLGRNLLLGCFRTWSCEEEVLDGLRLSRGLEALSREVTLGIDSAVFGSSASSSSESDERDSRLVVFGSKSVKLWSVLLEALEVRVCLLDTLAA